MRSAPDLRLFGVAVGMWGASLAALRMTTTGACVLAGAAAVGAGVLGAGATHARRARAVRLAAYRGGAVDVEAHRARAADVEARRAGAVDVEARRASPAGVEARRGGPIRAPAWVPRHRRGPAGVAFAMVGVLLGVVCGALSTAARTAARDAEPLAGLVRDQAEVRVELSVTDDPRPLVGGGTGPPTYLIPATLTHLDRTDGGPGVRLDVRVVVFATDAAWRTYLPSQRVATTARLAPARGGDLTAAALTATGSPTALDHPSWTQLAAGRLRAGLQAACLPLPPAPGGLLPGLVVGDTSRLDQALADQFRTTGLTHLVAVSGANCAIVLSVVLFLARWCRARPWVCAVICGAALVGFVILARPSPSVVRAAAMGAVALLALATGRVRSAAPALAAAVVVGLLVDPALAVDAGFALSVLATGALVLLAPGWRDALVARGVPGVLAEALAVPAAAQVACGPVIVALSGQVSLVAIPANLLAAPAVAPATLLGVGSTLVSAVWSDGARWLAWLASWPARWLVWVATTGAAIPDSAVPWPGGLWGALALAALTIGLVLAWHHPTARRLVLISALAVAIGAVPVRLLAPGWPPADAAVVACDVGQGDAIVLPDAPGEAVVVDAGPDAATVDGCLRRLGVRRVAALVLTHFHADHIGGIAGVLGGREVGAVVVPSFHEPLSGYDSVLAAAGRVPIVEASVGWTLQRGPLDLRVIGPTRIRTGTRSDPNNNSLVMRAVSHGITVLLMGDAETEEQADLLSGTDPADLRADVLKVAHHGSSYQDADLLAAVHPRVALVSVGVDNPYGHPNAALLANLQRDGARILRTDRDGDVAVVKNELGTSFVIRGGTGSVSAAVIQKISAGAPNRSSCGF